MFFTWKFFCFSIYASFFFYSIYLRKLFITFWFAFWIETLCYIISTIFSSFCFLTSILNFIKLNELRCVCFSICTSTSKKKFDTCFDFLDIFLNSIVMKTRFFENKFMKTKKLIVNALRSHNFQKKNLEKLINFLIFCVKIIIFDRSFFISLYKTLDRINHICNIITTMRVDFF